jgi:hypothetical protein
MTSEIRNLEPSEYDRRARTWSHEVAYMKDKQTLESVLSE